MSLLSSGKQMPIRSTQHISETDSSKLFKSIIPSHWIIRGVDERDYGIDYYIELTTLVDNNQVMTGKLISIQLKSRDEITWTNKGTYAVSDIKISTTNYWNDFSVPVFIFLADLSSNKLYWLNVRSFIRANYHEYCAQRRLTYHFDQNNFLDLSYDTNGLLEEYQRESERAMFESTLLTFLSSLQPYAEFIRTNGNLDHHMPIESENAVFLASILSNYNFITGYLDVENSLPTFEQLQEKNKRYFPNDSYDLHQVLLNEISDDLEKTTLLIVDAAERFIGSEEQYWIRTNTQLVNFIGNIDREYIFY